MRVPRWLDSRWSWEPWVGNGGSTGVCRGEGKRKSRSRRVFENMPQTEQPEFILNERWGESRAISRSHTSSNALAVNPILLT